MTGGDLARLRPARNAVATVFFLCGLVIATWLSRIPQVRDRLELTPGQLGWVLLALAAGSVLALPTAGLVINRIGARRTVAGGVLLAGLGMALVGLGGGLAASVALVAAGLMVVGYGGGIWDVAMNVEGAAIERRRQRALMPRLHAAFSLGTVAGAGAGALAAAAHLPVAVHLTLAAVVITAIGVPATRWFLPDAGVPAPSAGGAPPMAAMRLWTAWREPRTVLIGVLVLTFALSEGVAYDWLAVALIDGLGVSNATGAVGLAFFVAAMTVGRTLGTRLIDRFGRVLVLRASAALAMAGVLLVVFSDSLPLALIGALIWGLGTALGFPIGVSAGADDAQRAAIRVSVVATVAYVAFLAGPPLLGWLGDQFGVQRALLVVAAVLAVGTLAARATRGPVVADAPAGVPDPRTPAPRTGEGLHSGAGGASALQPPAWRHDEIDD